jgi:predicted transcriptional regulator
MRDAVSQPQRLYLHPELSLLFTRVASERELKVLSALRQAPRSVADLSDATDMPYEEVELALAELLRRGVLLTESPVDPSSTSGLQAVEKAEPLPEP